MPELQFKGKEFVRHHLTVPYRPPGMDVSRSIGKSNLKGNPIIHGDNLHALKSAAPVLRWCGRNRTFNLLMER
jgi:adenine-specific DNA-methyltransferase